MNSAVMVFLLLALSAMGASVAGIYILTNLGWALIASSAWFLIGAVFIRTGIVKHG